MIRTMMMFGMVIALALLSYALYTQHAEGLYPCVRCIYQRGALLIIIASGIVGLLHHRLHIIGIMGAFLGSIYGLYQAYIHVGVIKGTIIDVCGFRPDFGSLGALDRKLPWLFSAGGDCADASWQLWGLSMPEWMFVVFSVYGITTLVLIYLWINNLFKRHKP